MRRAISILLLLALILGVTACGANTPNAATPSKATASGTEKTAPNAAPSAAEPAPSAATGSGKTLVTYFSMPETTDPNNMTEEEENSAVVIDGEVLGNTQYMAQVIAQTTGADIFRIEPETPYPTNHSTLVEQASAEQAANARPAIKNQIADFNAYDTVFIGYPIWWSDMPMLLYSLFDAYDFSGKTIVPFGTHGGSGFAGTPAKMWELEPNATMRDGLTISRDNIQKAEAEIVNWVEGLDIS